jgi:phosphosulfolactate phosphohydrolase-like enzyme
MEVFRAGLQGGTLDAPPADAAVVIDVLRATSTAAVLVGRGVPRVRVATVEEAGGLSRQSHLLVSERVAGGIDNSPSLAASLELDARLPVLITTNGTRALAAAERHAPLVVAASFLNLTATVEYLVAATPARVLVVPAGDFDTGERHLEDELCADAIAGGLSGRPLELPPLYERVRRESRVQQRLREEPLLARDLDLSLMSDRYPVVMRFSRDVEGRGWLARP